MRPPSKQCRGKWSEEGDNGFHASPFALRRASRASFNGKSDSEGLPKSDKPIICSTLSTNASNAESKSGAAAMRRAFASSSEILTSEEVRAISVFPSFAHILRETRSHFQGLGVWSVLFIVLCCVVFGCCGGKISGGIIGNDQSRRNARKKKGV